VQPLARLAQPSQPGAQSAAGPQTAFVIPQADLSFLNPDVPAEGLNGAFVDERGLPTSSGDIESYPVAVGRRNEIQRNAQQAGSTLPQRGAGLAAAIAPEATTADVPAPLQRRPRAFDAVEGTAKDPLRNKSFDLTTPKTVPTLR
jgi:hypothetical protein